MAHELIPLTEWPTIPAPFSSTEPGEAWVWGDFVAILQVQPMSLRDTMNSMMGKKPQGPSPMTYPYALSVFYRKDRNPHGPSARPIWVATLEKADYAAVMAVMAVMAGKNVDTSALPLPEGSPIVQGLFTAGGRFNLGEFQQSLTVDTARDYFFTLARQQLALPGDPVHIGPISAVHGHPDTGWPVKVPRKSGKGCLVTLAMVAVACALLLGVFVRLI